MQSNECPDGSICVYAGVVYKAYKALERERCSKEVKVDGRSLDISSVVAVSRQGSSLVPLIIGPNLSLSS